MKWVHLYCNSSIILNRILLSWCRSEYKCVDFKKYKLRKIQQVVNKNGRTDMILYAVPNAFFGLLLIFLRILQGGPCS